MLLLFPRQNAKVNVVLNRVIRENTWLMGSMLLLFPSQMSRSMLLLLFEPDVMRFRETVNDISFLFEADVMTLK